MVIKDLINDNRNLFWFIPEKEKENIGEDQLVETILNYGDEKAVKRLLDVMGVNKVANIFRKHIELSNRRRNNYHELVANFFHLYFKRHAS